MDYIAIDIGASSGRLIHAHFTGPGGYDMNEIHRFKNGFHFKEGRECWDIHHLVKEILQGLEKAKQLAIAECYVGIDTWGDDQYRAWPIAENTLTSPVGQFIFTLPEDITEPASVLTFQEYDFLRVRD